MNKQHSTLEIFKIMEIPEAALKRIVNSTKKAAQSMAALGMTIKNPPTYCHRCKRYHPAGQKECRLPERKPNVDTGAVKSE